jgi:hypothetical protein
MNSTAAQKAHAILGLGLKPVWCFHRGFHRFTFTHTHARHTHQTILSRLSSITRKSWASHVQNFLRGSMSSSRSTIPRSSSAELARLIVKSSILSIVRFLPFDSFSRLGPLGLAFMYLWGRSGHTNDARQNERKTRIRIYREFQSDAKCVQVKADREGTFSSLSASIVRPLTCCMHLQPIPVEKLVKCKMQCVAFSRFILFLVVTMRV